MKTINTLRPNFVFERDFSDGRLNDDIQGSVPTVTGTTADWINSSRGQAIRTRKIGTKAGCLYSNTSYNINSGTIIAMISRNAILTGIQEIVYGPTRHNLFFKENAVGMYDYGGVPGFMPSGFNITDLNPHVVVIKFENGADGVKFYVDGTEGNTDTWTIGASSNELSVGYGPDSSLSGGADIHYLAISSSTTITAEQISKLSAELLSKPYISTLTKKNFELPNPEVDTTDLVGYWDLSKRDNVVADLSGFGDEMTQVGGVVDTAGVFGRACKFYGTTGYLSKTVSNYRSADSEGTISAWIKLDALGAIQTIFSSDDTGAGASYLNVQVSTTGKLTVYQNDNAGTPDGVASTNTLITDRWYHVCLSSSGSAYKLYINGVSETLSVLSGTNSGDWFADTTLRDNVVIGALIRTSPFYFMNGTIDSVKVRSRQLTDAEVLAEYNEGARKLIYRNTFEDAQVTLGTSSGELNGWLTQTGSFKTGEDSTGKHLLCVTDGQVKTRLDRADLATTNTFSISGTPTLTKNTNDLQIDAVAGEKVYSVILTL